MLLTFPDTTTGGREGGGRIVALDLEVLDFQYLVNDIAKKF